MLSLYPVPGTIFCVVHEPSNLIFPAPSSCSPLPLHLSGLWGGFTKIIRIKGRNLWAAVLLLLEWAGQRNNLPKTWERALLWPCPESLHLPISFQTSSFHSLFLRPKGIWQALHLNAYSSVINIIQARNMGEAVPTPLISGLEIAEKRCRSFQRGAEAGERSGSEHRLRSWISWDQIPALPLTRWVPWLFHASYSLPIKWEYY